MNLSMKNPMSLRRFRDVFYHPPHSCCLIDLCRSVADGLCERCRDGETGLDELDGGLDEGRPLAEILAAQFSYSIT